MSAGNIKRHMETAQHGKNENARIMDMAAKNNLLNAEKMSESLRLDQKSLRLDQDTMQKAMLA